MATERQRREALGVGLVALALLTALALGSGFAGPTGEGGNLVGPAGETVHRALTFALGPLSLVLVIPMVAFALHAFGLWDREPALRWTVFALALLGLGPSLLHLSGAGQAWSGWWGVALGEGLQGALGTVGGALVAGSLLLSLGVLTVGWSPVGGIVGAVRAAGRTAAGLADGMDRLLDLGNRAAARVTARVSGGGGSGNPWEDAAREREPGEEAQGAVAAPVSGEENGSTGEGDASEEAFPLPDPGDTSQTRLPPLELLSLPEKSSRGLSERELRELGQVLIDKLESFRVEGEIQGWTTGPVVTQFEVVPAAGVKVGQIAARADDLALALKAPSVRIVAPIPGKGAVGVEVPNPEPEVVYLREVLESRAYRSFEGALPLALGRDLAGDPYCTDLARMPHLLIAGATGSGKSVCINTIITSLIFRYSPQELRLLMIDPKMVELSVYEGLPHLRHPVVTDNDDAASVLKWLKHEMNRRYELLSKNGARSLPEFNRKVRSGGQIRVPGRPEAEYTDGELPYLVLLIDELADLMMTVQAEVEGPLAMLAQKARAVGIHLVIATQRPSVNVITGLIKANFPSRIAFRVASKTDSRTILDQNGAESLLGNGDMLFLPPGESDPVRIQGAFIGSGDTERLVEWYRQQIRHAEAFEGEDDILDVVDELEQEEARVDVQKEVLEERDELFRQAAEIVVANDSGSTSLLQRRLRIGYGRAARIIDQLHHAGIVGPSEGSQPREVRVEMQDLDEVLEEEA